MSRAIDDWPRKDNQWSGVYGYSVLYDGLAIAFVSVHLLDHFSLADVDMGLCSVDQVAESGILIVEFIPAGVRTENGFPLRPRVLISFLRTKVNLEMR